MGRPHPQEGCNGYVGCFSTLGKETDQALKSLLAAGQGRLMEIEDRLLKSLVITVPCSLAGVVPLVRVGTLNSLVSLMLVTFLLMAMLVVRRQDPVELLAGREEKPECP